MNYLQRIVLNKLRIQDTTQDVTVKYTKQLLSSDYVQIFREIQSRDWPGSLHFASVKERLVVAMQNEDERRKKLVHSLQWKGMKIYNQVVTIITED